MDLKHMAAVGALAAMATAVTASTQESKRTSAAASSAEFVPLTHFRAMSILVKYNGPLVEGTDLSDPARRQIAYEQSMWQRIAPVIAPCGAGAWCMKANPSQPAFLEWQALSGQKSARAEAALTALLEPGSSGGTGVFVFSRASVEGREATFAANELVPVYRQLLQHAGARAPSKVMLSAQIPNYSYDFARKALVLGAAARTSSYGTPEPEHLLSRGQRVLDDQPMTGPAAERAVYFFSRLPNEQEDESPARHWRTLWSGSANVLPYVSGIGTDRQLRLETIPMEPSKAEPLIKQREPLTARFYLTIDGAQVIEPKTKRPRDEVRPFAILLARVDRIDIVSSGDQLIASVPASQLPAAEGASKAEPARPKPGATPRAANAATQASPQTSATDDPVALKERIKATAAELGNLRRTLMAVCRQAASKVDADERSTAYRKAYNACMQ